MDNKKLPAVSLIIVNFNGKKFLKSCFDSVLKLDYPKNKLEIIMVDNGSTDDSVEFVKMKYPRVIIIHNQANNYCQANNGGIKKSKGRFIALINNDVRLEKRWLIKLIEIISIDKRIGLVGGKVLAEDGTIQNAGHISFPNFYWDERGAGEDKKSYSDLEEIESLPGAAVLYRKSVFRRVGFFDEDFVMYGEDVDMCFRLKKAGFRIIFVPQSTACHVFHGTANADLARFYIERNRLLFLSKYFPEKLCAALSGNMSKIAQKLNYSALIYKILPDLLMKLLKHHQSSLVKQIFKDLGEEIKKILTFENHSFSQQIIEKDKTIKEVINKIEEFKIELNKANNFLADKEKQIVERDSRLCEREQLIDYLKRNYDKILNELSQKESELKQKLSEIASKDFNLAEKDKLVRSLNEKIAQLCLELSEKKAALDENILNKKISQLRLDLSNTTSILEETKQSLTEKELILKENEKFISDLKEELYKVYGSKGYRRILIPLKKILKFFFRLRTFIFKKVKNLCVIFPLSILCILFFLLIHFFIVLESLIWAVLKNFLVKNLKKRRIVHWGDKVKISIVIPNFNGKHLIKECLTSLYNTKYLKDKENEIIVVDDSSSDASVDFIQSHFPEVKLIRNKKNMKFGFTCNRGIKEAKNELIVLLNNDITVTENFLEPIFRHFNDERVFAVTPKLYAEDHKTFIWGMHMGRFHQGYIRLWNESETKNGDKIYQAAPSVFAIGGALVFRRNDFLWLGGFDEIFRPNSWEDIDISYRAWKRGLKVIYEPASLLYHKGKATVTYERHKEIKNELSFIWKNITDREMVTEHLKYFLLHLYKEKRYFLKGFFWAVSYFPTTLIHRLSERRFIKESDKRIFDFCMNFYRNFERNNFRHREKNDKKNILLITAFMPFPLNTGGKIRIHTLVKLLKNKYNFYLLTLINNEKETQYVQDLKKVFSEVYTVYYKTPLPKLKIIPQRYKYSYSTLLMEQLREIQKKIPLDLIHIESNELLYLTKEIKHVPIAYTEHDISMLSFKNSYYQQKAFSFLEYFDFLKRIYFHSRIYKDLNRVVILSLEDRSALKKWFPQTRISYIPTGVDVDYFNFMPPKTDSKENLKRLIFIGHYPHFPNQDAIVYFAKNIFPLIKKEQRAELLVVGSNPTRTVQELAKDETIKVIGTVEDVRPYLCTADVFINPIRFSAGIKGKVLEAMSSGLPVVSTRLGSYGINAVDGREIIIADSPKKFASAVLNLLNNKVVREKIIANARKLVEEKYDWKRIVPFLKDTYENTFYKWGESDNENDVLEIIEKTEFIVQEAFNISALTAKNDNESSPEELHIELTYSCNSKCIMCDLWDFYQRNPQSGRDKELTLDEIKNFVQNSKLLKEIKTIVLSGGEPFLRKDITEICSFLSGYYPRSSIGILSNCLDWKYTLQKTKEILESAHPHALWIGTSLDGVGTGHDTIRGVSGAFAGLQKSIDIFRKEVPQVRLCTTFTMTPYNLDQLLAAKNFAKKEGLDFFAQFAVPKEARENFVWKTEQFKKAEQYVLEIIKDFIGDSDYNFILEKIQRKAELGLISQIYYYANLVNYQRYHYRPFKKCIAGRRFAMLNPFGDVFFCPILKDKTIGNVRSASFDDVWTSNAASEVRSFIEKGVCNCWLVCILIPLVEEAIRSKEENKLIYHQIKLEQSKLLLNNHTKGKLENSVIDLQALQEENNTLNEEEYRQGKIVLESFPQGIGLGAHYNCNSNCIFCFKQKHSNFNFKIFHDFFEKKLNDAINRAKFINFCGFGELLLMPKIEEFLDYINKKIPHVNKILTTNGSSIRKEIIKRLVESKYNIQISLLASQAQIHKKLTRTDFFDSILKQIESLVFQRTDARKPGISLVFIMNTLNIEDLPRFVKLAGRLGVDEVICNYMLSYTPAHLKFSCYFQQELTNKMLKEAQEIAESLNIRISLPPKFSVKEEGNNLRCNELWKYFYVETEGSVLPCCFAGSHIGYLDQDDFATIWNGKTYQNLRRSLIEGNLNEWCRHCFKNNPLNVNNIRAHVTFRTDLQERILKGIKL